MAAQGRSLSVHNKGNFFFFSIHVKLVLEWLLICHRAEVLSIEHLLNETVCSIYSLRGVILVLVTTPILGYL